MKKVYTVIVTDLYEHNMGTMETRKCLGVYIDIESAVFYMHKEAIKKLEELDFPMTGDSNEAKEHMAILHKSWIGALRKGVSKANSWNYFNVMNVDLPEIDELWDSERFYIEIFETDLYEEKDLYEE